MFRAAFERTRAKFPNFIVQRSHLRMELPLRSNTTTYQFQMKQGSFTTDGPNPVLLNDNDAFVLLGFFPYVMKQNPSSTPPQYNNSQRFTYPDPQVFVGAPAGQASEWEALLAVWNGQFSFNTQSLVRIKPIDLYPSLYAPAAQVVPAGATNSLANASLAQFEGPNERHPAFIELQPTLLIDGSQSNVLTVTLGSGDITAIDGSYAADGDQDAVTRNYLGIVAIGLLIQEGSAASKRFATGWE